MSTKVHYAWSPTPDTHDAFWERAKQLALFPLRENVTKVPRYRTSFLTARIADLDGLSYQPTIVTPDGTFFHPNFGPIELSCDPIIMSLDAFEARCKALRMDKRITQSKVCVRGAICFGFRSMPGHGTTIDFEEARLVRYCYEFVMRCRGSGKTVPTMVSLLEKTTKLPRWRIFRILRNSDYGAALYGIPSLVSPKMCKKVNQICAKKKRKFFA